MMGNIYRLARRVLVWLGPEENDSDLAMRCMEYIGSQVDVNYILGTLKAAENCADKSVDDRNMLLPLDSMSLDSIYYLLCRPWFKRLWIRQGTQIVPAGLVQSEAVFLIGG